MPTLFNRRRKWILAALVANGFSQAALTITTAFLVERVFNLMFTRGARALGGDLWWLLGILFGVALLRSLLLARETVDAERLGQDYVHALRLRLYDHVMGMSPRALRSRSLGGSMLRFIGDLTAVRNWVSQGVARLVVSGTTVVAVLVAMAFIDWPVAVALAVVIALSGLLTLRFGREIDRTSRESRRRRSRVAANVGQQLQASAVVQAFGGVGRERARMRKQSNRLQRAMVDRARANGRLQATADAASSFGTVAALTVGLVSVGAGQTSPGGVVAAMTIVGLLTTPLRDLGRIERYRRMALVAYDKLNIVMNRPSGIGAGPDAPDLMPGPGRISVENVGVAGVLTHVSAVAEPSQLTVLIGPNGSGKSTLLALIAGLLEPEAGDVRIDGQRLADHSPDSIRRAIGVAGPEFPLLRGTLGRNLRYRAPQLKRATREAVWKRCGIPELLAELPDGENTRITEAGGNLSAGQKQRVALARALLGEPRILLLDEADVNLDPESRQMIVGTVEAFPGTVLLVTHNPAWLERADRVWHLDDGQIVEHGEPHDILATPGPTTRLFGREPAALTS